jgi:dUTP pyrophosphatase
MSQKFNKNEEFDLYEEIKKITNSISEESDVNLYKNISDEFGIDLKELENQMSETLNKVTLEYSSKISEDLKYNYISDSGFDLYSTEDILIEPFGRALVPTGVHFNIPENFEIQVRSKSGLALKQGLMVLNSPGTVDEGYTGEIQVIIFNTNKEPFQITKGMKVAQAVLSKCYPGKVVNLVRVNEINDKDRGDKGFGSTGI